MNKDKSLVKTYTLESLLKTINLNQLIKIKSINIPLFFGTKNQYLKLQDYEYKGLNNYQIKNISIQKENDNNYMQIELDFKVDFNKIDNFSFSSKMTKDGD